MLAESALATYVGTKVTNSGPSMPMFCQQRSCIPVKGNRILNVVTVKINVKLIIESKGEAGSSLLPSRSPAPLTCHMGVPVESW